MCLCHKDLFQDFRNLEYPRTTCSLASLGIAIVHEPWEHIKLSVGMIHSSDQDFLKLLAYEPENRKSKRDPSSDAPSHNGEAGLVNFSAQLDKMTCPSFEQQVRSATAPKGQGGGIAFPLSTCKISQISDGRITHVRDLILKYLEVTKRELCDYLPKYLMFHLAQETLEKIPEAVKKRTLGKETALVSEPEEIRMRRKHLQELLKNLREAAKIIRDINVGW